MGRMRPGLLLLLPSIPSLITFHTTKCVNPKDSQAELVQGNPQIPAVAVAVVRPILIVVVSMSFAADHILQAYAERIANSICDRASLLAALDESARRKKRRLSSSSHNQHSKSEPPAFNLSISSPPIVASSGSSAVPAMFSPPNSSSPAAVTMTARLSKEVAVRKVAQTVSQHCIASAILSPFSTPESRRRDTALRNVCQRVSHRALKLAVLHVARTAERLALRTLGRSLCAQAAAVASLERSIAVGQLKTKTLIRK